MNVKIRPLREDDAEISYKWRNDPSIWKYTGNKPGRNITVEIERDWLCKVLERPDEKRFAICVDENDRYVGNVQLTNISEGTAQFHIFIGEVDYHGRGIGTKATLLILEYAFSVLNLKSVFLFVNKNNIGAIKLYRKCGFHSLEEADEKIKMVINNERN